MFLAGCATVAPQSFDFSEADDLQLYAESSLVGLHNHGNTPAWRGLNHREYAVTERRNVVFTGLAALYGRAEVGQIDAELEDISTVRFEQGPTFEEERDRLDRASAALSELERRLARGSAS